jgi:hypothetical protein
MIRGIQVNTAHLLFLLRGYRQEYQWRIDAGESVLTLAMERKVSVATLRAALTACEIKHGRRRTADIAPNTELIEAIETAPVRLSASPPVDHDAL